MGKRIDIPSKTKSKKSYNSRTNLKKLNSHINFKLEGSKSNSRKRDTTIYCCLCKKKTTLPFKPRNPEVYCDECFKKKKSQRYQL